MTIRKWVINLLCPLSVCLSCAYLFNSLHFSAVLMEKIDQTESQLHVSYINYRTKTLGKSYFSRNFYTRIGIIQALKPSICKTIGILAMNYVTVSGDEYLIEVKNSLVRAVPSTWIKISALVVNEVYEYVSIRYIVCILIGRSNVADFAVLKSSSFLENYVASESC